MKQLNIPLKELFKKKNKNIIKKKPVFFRKTLRSNIKEKAELFYFFFYKKCSLIPNRRSVLADVNYIYDKGLSTVTFLTKDTGKIIQNLDSKKAHGYDNMSIRMLKICGDSIFIPLEMIFKQALLTTINHRIFKTNSIFQMK